MRPRQEHRRRKHAYGVGIHPKRRRRSPRLHVTSRRKALKARIREKHRDARSKGPDPHRVLRRRLQPPVEVEICKGEDKHGGDPLLHEDRLLNAETPHKQQKREVQRRDSPISKKHVSIYVNPQFNKRRPDTPPRKHHKGRPHKPDRNRVAPPPQKSRRGAD